MEGMQVFVCRFPENKCLPCGVAARTDSEKWASVYCTGGWVEGNQIKVTHSYGVLQFCEVQVFGTELSKSLRFSIACQEQHKRNILEIVEHLVSKKPNHKTRNIGWVTLGWRNLLSICLPFFFLKRT